LVNKRNVIISIPLVWGIRNFILSGLGEELEKYFHVYYCIPSEAIETLKLYNIDSDKVVINKPIKRNYLLKRLHYILKVTHNNLYPTKSFKIFQEDISTNNNSSSLLMNWLHNIERLIIFIFSNKYLFQFLVKLERFFFDKKIDREFLSNIQQINPIYGLSTSCVVESEWTLLRILKKSKSPIYAHILSFDNITSRGYLPIGYFDKYLVWNERMKDELIELYSISSGKILITGTPQFDFHKNPKYLLSKEVTKTKLRIGDRPYILYCANHYKLTPDEPALLETIVNLLLNDAYFKNFVVVLRLHPMDNYDRWDELLRRYSNIRRNIPWEHKENRSVSWGEPSIDDLILFGNALRYSSVMLNIASTVTIDAAITNTPSICLGFHPEDKIESQKYYNYHFSDHFAIVSQIGSSPIAVNEEQFLELIRKCAKNPSYLETNRKKLVEEICTYNDGKAVDRLEKTLGIS
jgi:hypothetical protein